MKFLFLVSLILTACSHGPATEEVHLAPVPPVCAPYDGKSPPKRFAGFDADKNGEVSRDEFLCRVSARFTALNKDPEHYLTGKELSEKGLWKLPPGDDGEKSVNVLEFMQAAEKSFDLADKDKSGTLNAAEFKAARRQLPL